MVIAAGSQSYFVVRFIRKLFVELDAAHCLPVTQVRWHLKSLAPLEITECPDSQLASFLPNANSILIFDFERQKSNRCGRNYAVFWQFALQFANWFVSG